MSRGTRRAPRRLPGVRFAAVPPPAEPWPRMDVAVFVGFAAEGPLDVPVALESAGEYAEIFGADVVLAEDPARGEPLHASLGPAVRAFFRNGGRRCWVVRVAGASAAVNRFPLTGLLRASEGGLVPALARAKAHGSASDRLRVGTALESRPLKISGLRSGFAASLEVDLAVEVRSEVQAGDLLRFVFADHGLVWLLPVEAVNSDGQRAWAVGRSSFWFRSGAPEELPGGSSVDVFAGELVASTYPLVAIRPEIGDRLGLLVAMPLVAAPEIGAFVRVALGPDQLWVRVDDVRPETYERTSGGGVLVDGVLMTGPALRWLKGGVTGADADALLGARMTAERLSFELHTRRGDTPPQRMIGLGLVQAHPRFWGALPTDEELSWKRLGRVESVVEERWAALWDEASRPRCPLAGDAQARFDGKTTFLPIGMAFIPDALLGALPSSASPRRRDGLEDLDRKKLFLDDALAEVPACLLVHEADYLRYHGTTTRELRGIHAALSIDEASIIAIPDAAHRPWHVSDLDVVDDEPDATPDPGARAPGHFSDCRIPLAAPEFLRPVSVDPTGSFTLRWTSAAGPDEHYVVEESADRGFTSPLGFDIGTSPSLTLWGRPAGIYRYRVRVENAVGQGPWSAPLVVRVGSGARAVLAAASDEPLDGLLDVHLALLRMCAARGDLLAVLGMPEHYRETMAIAHADELVRRAAQEPAVLGFGALYHPWIVVREDAHEVRRSPPEGAIAGVMAHRALTRGAWVPPANDPLVGIVTLMPEFRAHLRQAFQDAQVNLIRPEARGFLALSADTLSADPDLTPIHVRRTLILLRRLALGLGALHVFEPHDGALRRLVQRRFEAMLGRMFTLGAFAGTRESDAFQVTSNAGADDGGRSFTVDLRVAPATPMSFLTVRLVQSGAVGRVTEFH